MKKLSISVVLLLCAIVFNAQNKTPELENVINSQGSQAVFIANKGQVMDLDENFHPEVKYTFSDGLNSMYFESNRVVCVFAEKEKFDYSPYYGNQSAIDSIYATLGMYTQRIDMEFLGASSNCVIVAEEEGPTVYNYFLNKRENIRDVKAYKHLVYKNVYPNIDIVFHYYGSGIKYDIILHPGADINDVKIRYNGANSLELNNNSVSIETKYYTFTEELPLAFFNNDNTQIADVQYVVNDDVIAFECNYSNSEILTIDPTLTWSTYFETSGALGSIDYDHNVADTAGNLYISGYCNNNANTYPTVNPGGSAYIQTYTSNDLYIAKFDVNRSLVWATYFGGSNSSMDWGLGTEVMAIGGDVLHIVGDALADNGPFLNGGGFYYNAGSSRPYYTRFNKNTGVLLHCTNIPGHTSSHPSIAISPSGQVAIILDTYDWGVTAGHIVNRSGAYNQAVNGGFKDVFLMLLNSSYSQIWGTFLGGPSSQENCHVAFDSNNNIFFSAEVTWLSGSTAANELLLNPGGGAYYQSANDGEDIMIGKFTSSGVLYWNTLYGGNGNDGLDSEMGNGTKVIINPSDELIVIGGTNSNNFPLMTMSGAYNQTCPANVNVSGGSYSDFASFILKFSNTGVRQWATYWGENSASAWALLYDGKFTACNQFVVAARASYTPTPYTGYYNHATGVQSFLMQFDSNYALDWSSYVGDNTLVPQISYTQHGNRLYLSTRTYANETTVDPGGGAYYDDVKTGSSSYMIWEFNMAPAPNLTGVNTICEGDSTLWSASVSGGTWSSSDPGVATIDPSTGLIIAFSSGTTIISYSSSVTGCTVYATDTITVEAIIDAAINPAGPFCLSDAPTQITAVNSGGTWAGTGITNTSNGTFDPSIAGIGSHEITYTTSGNCPDTDTITVVVDSIIDATINPAGPFCLSDPATNLTAANTGGTWAGTGITNASNGTFDPATAGVGSHEITYTTSGNCPDTDTVTVVVDSIIDATINPAGPFCLSDPATNLTAANSGGTWAGTGITNASNGTFDPATAGVGNHEITYTTSGNCPDTDTITVVVDSIIDATIDPAGPFCVNGGIEILTAANTGGTWSGSGITNPSAGTFDPSIAGVGTHEIVYTTSGSCGDTDTAFISVVSQLDATITAAGPFCNTDTIVTLIAASPGGVWSGIGITDPNAGEFNPFIAGIGTHTITYAIAGDCGDTAMIDIVVQDCSTGDNDPHAVVPNAFSPNGDGENDVLYVRGEGVEQLNFIIYDRWGEKVFETQSLDMGWDGTFRGKEVDPGVFVYYLNAIFIDGTSKTEKGDITLIR
ncbi:MAG: hypothetical protein C0592_04810 [Marinilabiliales bacterium]|nr:MAG: hypothetical protein C0592_04810 [Marinilabiliales bacterium]